jgi:hypothetical protein
MFPTNPNLSELHQILSQDDEIEEYEMGGVSRTHGEMNAYKIFVAEG